MVLKKDADEGKHGAVAALSKRLAEAPPIAWPTVVLAAASSLVFVGALALRSQGVLSPFASAASVALAAYGAFTPAHEAVHGNVATNASGYRWLNDFVGRVCGFMLLSPYVAFRHLHLQHHRYTVRTMISV